MEKHGSAVRHNDPAPVKARILVAGETRCVLRHRNGEWVVPEELAWWDPLVGEVHAAE